MERNRFKDLIDRDRQKAMDMEGVSTRGLTPSKRYKVDPNFQRVPVAICWNTKMGLPTCSERGEGKYCYCRIPCEEQMRLDNPEIRIPAAEALFQETQKKLRVHARKNLSHSDERAIDEFADALLAAFEAEAKER